MTTPMSSLDSNASHGLVPPLTLAGASTPLANQVAGHQNVRADASGSLVIKPSLPKEIALYQMVNAAPRSSKLAKLKRFIPQFFGTLQLQGRLDEAGELKEDVAADVPESVVLQNLSYAFTKPNIMDAKLGTVLYEPGATAEKRAKMEKNAQDTTTATTGLRLTGCQTWHAPSSTFMLTPKSFGKKISTAELPSGMVRFFPAPKDIIPSLVLPVASPTTAKPAVEAAAPAPTATDTTTALLSDMTTSDTLPLQEGTYSQHAIPPKTMLRVLALIDKQLADLEAVLSILEMRFVGASVLMVYEGDLARLEDALEQWEVKIHEEDAMKVEPESDSEDEDDEYESESEGSDDIDGTKEDARMAKKCPPVTVKMIDFAHTWITEGQGVDEGVLMGLRTLRGLVQGRMKELEALSI